MYEEATHNTQECQCNGQYKPNFHIVYHTHASDQNQDHGDRGGGYQGRGKTYEGQGGGYQGRGRYKGGYHDQYRRVGHCRGRFNKVYFFICLNDDHISPEYFIKVIIDLNFFNICGFGYHCNEPPRYENNSDNRCQFFFVKVCV
jgi:hypothetical protein